MALGQVMVPGALGTPVRFLGASVGPSKKEQKRLAEELARKKEDIFTNAMMQMQMGQLQLQRQAETERAIQSSESGQAMWGDVMKLAPWLLGGIALTIIALAAIRPAPVRRRPAKKKKKAKAKAKKRTTKRRKRR